MSSPINVETSSLRASVFWILLEESMFSELIVLSNCWIPILFKKFMVFFLPQFFFLEQILYNIKQEYKRMQKRRHLETSFQQTDPCCTSEAQPHAFLLSGPASPGNKKLNK